MEEVNLIFEATKFAILGMGTVFLFLLTMVYILNIQAKIVGKFFPDKKEESTKQIKDDKKIVAVITGAIMAYKRGN